MTIREYLASCIWTRAQVDRFLDTSQPAWARFDPETGYRLSDIVLRDGVGGCSTINSYMPNGARQLIHYRNQPCRINTYGDSFTQCHQVSDGETWQEILAAHFGEPIRNFGVGGFGVYQAYRRMRRIEQTADGAPYVILNIYDDDHVRNLDLARWFRLATFRKALGQGADAMFHANPWAHVRWDQVTSRFIEHENPFPTPESLYQLCDLDTVYRMFEHDEIVQLACLKEGITIDNVSALEQLAASLNVDVDFKSTGQAWKSAERLFDEYALRSTLFTLDLVRNFLNQRKKKLMVLLSYGPGKVGKAINGIARIDQALLNYLQEHKIPHVDALTKHIEDAKAFRLNSQEYCDRLFIGHYNPSGNHFFAFAIKDALVNWLDPKPPTYAASGQNYTGASGKLA